MTPKFAFLSPVLPPSWSGQAIVIGRLLRGLDQNAYCLISRENYQEGYQDFVNRLPGRYYCLPPDISFTRLGREMKRQRLAVRLNVLRLSRHILGILLRERCRAVVAATADLCSLPAAYLAARMCGARFYPYLFDDYTYQWPDELKRGLARGFERRIFPRSAGIIVPNEFLREEIKLRHGLEASIVRNPCEGGEAPRAKRPPSQATDEINIVFTGAIYHVNYGAFRNLLASLKERSLSRVRLHIYTAIPQQVLNSEDICGPQVVYHGHVPPSEVASVQQKADVLFLPFALDMLPEIVKTSAPGKLADYLASGTPILALASEESFVYWYLKTHACGLVVGNNDPGELGRALARLAQDADLRRSLGRNALDRARRDFSPDKAQEDFMKVLERRP